MALGSGRSLEDLGRAARVENSQIHALTKKSAQDAAAVKVLTIMMLIYLPTTVVSVSLCSQFHLQRADQPQELLLHIFRGQQEFD